MLKDLNADQARFAALLAKAARAPTRCHARRCPRQGLERATVARGKHNARLVLDSLPAQDTQLSASRNALAALAAAAPSELYGLIHIGQGQLAIKKWRLGHQGGAVPG